MFSTGDLSDIEATVHPDYLDHQGLHGEPILGPAGFASVVAAARAGFATLEVAVEDLIAGRDRVAARLRWNGLRTEGKVDRQTLEIVRIEDGIAIEHWGGRSSATLCRIPMGPRQTALVPSQYAGSVTTMTRGGIVVGE